MSSSQLYTKGIQYSVSFNTYEQSFENTVCNKRIWNFPVILSTYCGNDLSVGLFVPERAQWTQQKKTFTFEVLSENFVFKV